VNRKHLTNGFLYQHALRLHLPHKFKASSLPSDSIGYMDFLAWQNKNLMPKYGTKCWGCPDETSIEACIANWVGQIL